MTEIAIPKQCLVVLIGVSGSGKSSFAGRHFLGTEVVSSDVCRGLVSDDENDQSATNDAFDLLHFIAAKRLAAGRLVVVDATNVQPRSRSALVNLAREHDVLPVAIVLDTPIAVCAERNAARSDRIFGPHVLRNQTKDLHRSRRKLGREGFRRVFHLASVDEIDGATIVREPMWTDFTADHGPFDLIGDVHGCLGELEQLLERLGYQRDATEGAPSHPQRTAVFVGDLVDRGPDSAGVLELVMDMVEAGSARCVPGNHENKLSKALAGRQVKVGHGLAETLAELDARPDEFRTRVATFIDGLVSHIVLDDGKLVVAHAGLIERYHGRASRRVREFALYGETTGETDEFGLPVRHDWARDYRGDAAVVYGHTPVLAAEWINNTMCLDTGCVFGGELTALRYPEREVVSVPASTVHYEPIKPLEGRLAEAREAAHLLDITDVTGKQRVETRLLPPLTIREDRTVDALEVMSRFAIDPRWLIYLPPTMAPVATSKLPTHIEYPDRAFEEFAREGITAVVCEEKHMGSRMVALVGRNPDAIDARFGITNEAGGRCWTRTGRGFFGDDHTREALVISELRAAIDATDLWDELSTDWLLLDTELLPWSAKAGGLIAEQFAPVATAGTATLGATVSALERAAARGIDIDEIASRIDARHERVKDYAATYAGYCGLPGDANASIAVAPFQVLAVEGEVCAVTRDHAWHLSVADRLAETSPNFIRSTGRRFVDLADHGAVEEATQWWVDLTTRAPGVTDGPVGEGMVVKPLDPAAMGPKGLVQPGLKVRGKSYLRVVYGPDYDAPENLEGVRSRKLGPKRSMARREFALGIEALERFTTGAPLHRVHQCVFAVLALESEPVDPRL